MYKYYLINYCCIEASNAQESHALASQYELFGFFFFFKQDFSNIFMVYIRYFCKSPNRTVKDERNVIWTMLCYIYFLCICFDKLFCLFYVEVISFV